MALSTTSLLSVVRPTDPAETETAASHRADQPAPAHSHRIRHHHHQHHHLLRRPRTNGLGLLPLLLLLVVACLVQPAAAAGVAFSNCLADDYRNFKDPVLLQWVPLHVDASFDTTNGSHALLVTMYGNVTGARTAAALAPWNSSVWDDANYTDGKILREPSPMSASPKLTTLHRTIDMLSYEPWSGDADFCDEALTNASCPLAPVFNTSFVPLYDLPSVSMTTDMNASYAFASFTATFYIRYGDDAATTVGCVRASLTPSLGHLAWAIKFLPLMVLLAVGFATVFAGMYSPWGTTDVFHWSSNYGRDPDLLRLVTPGFGDCLQYLQFAVLTGGLTLSYPGFYQPIVSQAAWSTLMFNQTLVSRYDGMPKTIDGLYVTNGTWGMQNLAQLAGMGQVEDIWAGMMVWLLVIIGGSLVVFQLVFAVQWVYRYVRKVPEEDLRSKNGPFSIGHVVRIVFNFMLLPIVALSSFQFVVASQSPSYETGLAAVTLVAIIGFSVWLLHLIISTKPRAVLFDDLPTLLLYGPLYNTYSDEAAFYALSPLALTLVRGIAIGAVQPAGIAQVVLLAICEVVQVLTLLVIQPFHRQSSMNAYHTLFAILRFVTIMLMIAFIPVLGVDEGTKGWVGYVILVIHAAVLIFGFFLNAIQTMLEVLARMAGAGGDDVAGQTRGGLSKIFGMRQLARRTAPRRSVGATSRQSQMSSAAMLVGDDSGKSGYVMPGGRLRSESAGSIGMLTTGRPGQRSSSALDNLSVENSLSATQNLESGGGGRGGSFTPTTPGEMTSYSYLPSGTGRAGMAGAAVVSPEASDPYYRPPRRPRRTNANADNNAPSPAERTRGSWASGDWSQGALSPDGSAPLAPAAVIVPGPAATTTRAAADTNDYDGPLPHGMTPAPYAAQPSGIGFSPRTDYTTREVDFYYGVRGQRLNSDAPNRRLGTGPADPTGPIASATGWFRSMLGGKVKEKGKGFEVVRSARMPPAMKARGGDFDDDGPPRGIPVAMSVIRSGPIESDDEDEKKRKIKKQKAEAATAAAEAQRKAAEREAQPMETPTETQPRETDLLFGDDHHGGGHGAGAGAGADGDEIRDDTSEATTDSDFVRVGNEPPLLPDIDAGNSIHISSGLPSRVQSQVSRHQSQISRHQSQISRHQSQISRHQSRASRYGAGGVPILDEVPHPPRKKNKVPAVAPVVPSLVVPAGLASTTDDGSSAGESVIPLSEASSSDFATVDLTEAVAGAVAGEARARTKRPTNFGHVQQGSVSRVDPEHVFASAEVVDER